MKYMRERDYVMGLVQDGTGEGGGLEREEKREEGDEGERWRRDMEEEGKQNGNSV